MSVEAHQTGSSDGYRIDYDKAFAERFDDFVDWPARRAAEGDFFFNLLREARAQCVLDAATGAGFHSVELVEAGFAVTSVDGSLPMLERPQLSAKRHGVHLNTVHSDWLELDAKVAGEFDAVLCLGNSFTFLFGEKDQREVLRQFASKLPPGGLLILDQRDYDRLLAGDRQVHGGGGCYRSRSVDVAVEFEISEDQGAELDTWLSQDSFEKFAIRHHASRADGAISE